MPSRLAAFDKCTEMAPPLLPVPSSAFHECAYAVGKLKTQTIFKKASKATLKNGKILLKGSFKHVQKVYKNIAVSFVFLAGNIPFFKGV